MHTIVKLMHAFCIQKYKSRSIGSMFTYILVVIYITIKNGSSQIKTLKKCRGGS